MNPFKEPLIWLIIYAIGFLYTMGFKYCEEQYKYPQVREAAILPAVITGLSWPIYWPGRFSINMWEYHFKNLDKIER